MNVVYFDILAMSDTIISHQPMRVSAVSTGVLDCLSFVVRVISDINGSNGRKNGRRARGKACNVS